MLVTNLGEDLEELRETILETPNIYTLPTECGERDLEELVSFCRDRAGNDWVTLALDDYTCSTAARLSQYSAKPLYLPESADRALDKGEIRKMWNLLCKSGASPLCQAVEFSLLEASAFDRLDTLQVVGGSDPADLLFPVIVKPSSLDGSVGVFRARSRAELTRAIQMSLEKVQSCTPFADSLGLSLQPRLILEQEIDGTSVQGGHGEFNAQFGTINGSHILLGVVDKIRDRGFIEMGHVFPSQGFPHSLLQSLDHAIKNLLDQLGVTNGLSNWDFFVVPNGNIVLVEGQLRPSGNHVLDILYLATDVEPLAILASKNFAWQINEGFKRVSAVVQLSISPTLESIRRVTMQENEEAYLYASPLLYNAKRWTGPTSGSNGCLRLISVANDWTALQVLIKQVAQRIRIEGVDSIGRSIESKVVLPRFTTGVFSS